MVIRNQNSYFRIKRATGRVGLVSLSSDESVYEVGACRRDPEEITD